MAKRTIGSGLVALSLTTLISSRAHAERCSDGRRAPPASREGSVAEPDPDSDCVERDIYLMPGTQAVYFAPTAGGPFYGAGVQLAPFQTSHNNDRFGPSQASMIAQVSLLKSPRLAGTMALFELGATASLERNSSRRWLIPYFGGSLGGLTQSDLGTSTFVYAHGGAHLYWHRNLMVDLEGGYHFPFVDIDSAKGPRAQLAVRFSMW